MSTGKRKKKNTRENKGEAGPTAGSSASDWKPGNVVDGIYLDQSLFQHQLIYKSESGVMQAFLKGATVQTTRPQKDKTAGPSTEKKTKAVPWVEKYRPKCVDEVAFQEEVVAVLKKSLEGADLPNLLFYGPPGTGKTSTILAAARELYGPELYRQRVLELNASDERGIQVVREKVKNFAQLTVAGTRSDGKPCPPFKIIVLDEADSMTAPAQAALRRTMEKESRTTRFCLICNYISRIIEPLTSRCSKFRFKPLANQIQEERLLMICDKENLKYTKESIAALVKVSEGDLRKAITFLQSAARLNVDREITERAVIEIAGVVPPKMIDNLLQICFKGTFEKLEVAVRNMVDEGYAATQILSQLHESIIEQDLSDKEKSAITEKMAVVSKCLSDGADEYLQMLSLCSVIMQETSQNN
ncbi:replication factor C subunit 4 [Lates japonicus]|uniref:Replication factor C subunit 4 n=1 Tax=Lates japonicus TaxID=270547 RepID=A0AAD3RE41_LATJO|nr:replication factor C subunit 4 [Lates japonicus]